MFGMTKKNEMVHMFQLFAQLLAVFRSARYDWSFLQGLSERAHLPLAGDGVGRRSLISRELKTISPETRGPRRHCPVRTERARKSSETSASREERGSLAATATNHSSKSPEKQWRKHSSVVCIIVIRQERDSENAIIMEKRFVRRSFSSEQREYCRSFIEFIAVYRKSMGKAASPLLGGLFSNFRWWIFPAQIPRAPRRQLPLPRPAYPPKTKLLRPSVRFRHEAV